MIVISALTPPIPSTIFQEFPPKTFQVGAKMAANSRRDSFHLTALRVFHKLHRPKMSRRHQNKQGESFLNGFGRVISNDGVPSPASFRVTQRFFKVLLMTSLPEADVKQSFVVQGRQCHENDTGIVYPLKQ